MIHCPDWKVLLEHRFDPALDEPEDWHLSLEHLEGCDDCRLEAYRADPSLLFLDLPAVEVTDAEIRDMQQAVTTLRQGLKVARNDSSEELTGSARRWNGTRTATRIAASLALTAGLTAGAFGIFGGDDAATGEARIVDASPDVSQASPAEAPDAATLPAPSAPLWAGRSPSLPSAVPVRWQDAPVVEEVGGPLTRIYNYPTAPDEKIALVMVIDPALDV